MPILITGDSLVEGVGGSDGGWAQSLAAKLHGQQQVSLHGIGGQTSDNLLVRIEPELSRANSPHTVVIAIGTNDSRLRPSLGRNEVPLARFAENVVRLIGLAGAKGARVHFVGLAGVDERLTSPFKPDKIYSNAEMARYDAALRQVAIDNGAMHIPLPGLTRIAGAFADGLHPSDHGHRLIFDAVVRALDGHEERDCPN